MCVAVFGKLVKVDDSVALSDVEGNLVTINIQLTPHVRAGQYVLIHAGFSIEVMPTDEVLTTRKILNEISRVVNNAE